MGKNKAIEALSSLIANTIVHKILINKTSRPESINHLEFEEIEYRSQAIKKGNSYNWNYEDIQSLKKEIENKIENKFKNKYADIEVSKEKIKSLTDKEVEHLLKTYKYS